jgi:hypothetical protein
MVELIVVTAAMLILILFLSDQSIDYFVGLAGKRTSRQLERISQGCLTYYKQHADSWPATIEDLKGYIDDSFTVNVYGRPFALEVPAHGKYIIIKTTLDDERKAWGYVRQESRMCEYDPAMNEIKLVTFKPKVDIDTIRDQKLVRTATLPSGTPTPENLRTINGDIYLDGAKIIGSDESFFLDITPGAESNLNVLEANTIKAKNVIIRRMLNVRRDMNLASGSINIAGTITIPGQVAWMGTASTNRADGFNVLGSTTQFNSGNISVYDLGVTFGGSMNFAGHSLSDIYAKASAVLAGHR